MGRQVFPLNHLIEPLEGKNALVIAAQDGQVGRILFEQTGQRPIALAR
jgi:hypothetical protein